MKRFRT